ncbi:ABC transporter permease [Pararcticibacter amylolyticus]|uniref:Probable membrane transporter protein n=2 Tax=Pararcticibacter amylolyticus TaxID=2173175 RepID=A0A2U2PN50_9SPHI|nr:ABC transporter permease [Pararcticibacter amylolyticus]
MTPDLITAYDLILIRSPGTSFTREVIRLARENGVLVSVLDAEDRGKNVARFNAGERYWKKIASRCLFALGFILTGSVIASYYPLGNLLTAIETFGKSLDLDATFGVMLLAGFVAQMVDGALGMGYGVISTTMLLSTGLNPAAISGSIHTAEMFSSGASGFSHYRFGNINKKLFRTLLLPGVIGAIAGALLLSYLGEQYGSWMRPVLSVYTLLLGLRILRNAFKKKNESRKVKHAGWLAGAGGFLDSFGGGGWGPLVTSTLISKGKTPRYIIGTVSLTEFFVTLGSALTFFVMLGTSHIETIAGLIIGGLLAAPIAARLAGKLKTKTMLIAVGVLVIISSLRIIIKAF